MIYNYLHVLQTLFSMYKKTLKNISRYYTSRELYK